MKVENKKYIVVELACESYRWEVGSDVCETFSNISEMPNKTKKLTDLVYNTAEGRPLFLYFMEEMAQNL